MTFCSMLLMLKVVKGGLELVITKTFASYDLAYCAELTMLKDPVYQIFC